MPKQLDEAHQIHIIKRNMLPHLALATATHDIRTISQLETICKRVESTRIHLFGADASATYQSRFKKIKPKNLVILMTKRSRKNPSTTRLTNCVTIGSSERTISVCLYVTISVMTKRSPGSRRKNKKKYFCVIIAIKRATHLTIVSKK